MLGVGKSVYVINVAMICAFTKFYLMSKLSVELSRYGEVSLTG